MENEMFYSPYGDNGHNRKRKQQRRAQSVFSVVLLIGLCLVLIGLLLWFYSSGGKSSDHTASPSPSPVKTPAQVLYTLPVEENRTTGALECLFIDVGQGSSSLFISPTGETLLVDGGTDGSFSAIDRVLKEYGVCSLTYVVSTHMHEDHIGALDEVLLHYPAGTIFMPDQSQSTASYQHFMDAVAASGAEVRIVSIPAEATGPLTVPFGSSAAISFLSPFAGPYDNDNDLSIILQVKSGETAVLVTGDAEITSERIMTKAFGSVRFRSDVLIVGHHGSADSTDDVFLKKVAPKYGVISCGKDNDYGHPHQKVLDKLDRAGVTVLRTDLSGTIHLTLDGTTVTVVE